MCGLVKGKWKVVTCLWYRRWMKVCGRCLWCVVAMLWCVCPSLFAYRSSDTRSVSVFSYLVYGGRIPIDCLLGKNTLYKHWEQLQTTCTRAIETACQSTALFYKHGEEWQRLTECRLTPYNWNLDPKLGILTWHRRHRDPSGGSSRVRPFHCTSVGLTFAITPNVGDSGAQFLLEGDCVRAIPWHIPG